MRFFVDSSASTMQSYFVLQSFSTRQVSLCFPARRLFQKACLHNARSHRTYAISLQVVVRVLSFCRGVGALLRTLAELRPQKTSSVLHTFVWPASPSRARPLRLGGYSTPPLWMENRDLSHLTQTLTCYTPSPRLCGQPSPSTTHSPLMQRSPPVQHHSPWWPSWRQCRFAKRRPRLTPSTSGVTFWKQRSILNELSLSLALLFMVGWSLLTYPTFQPKNTKCDQRGHRPVLKNTTSLTAQKMQISN